MALGRCSHCGSIFHDSEDCDIRIKDRMLEAENTRLKGELAEAIAILREGQSDLWACRDRHNEGPAYPLPWVGKAEKFLTRTQSIPVAEPLQCGKPDPITCVCDDTDCVCDFAAEPQAEPTQEQEKCHCPKYCPFHWELGRKEKRVCTCRTESDAPGSTHSPECYWLDNR
jgi:hypothetical protein